MAFITREVRLENTTPPHNKYYRIRVQRSITGTWRVSREWGRIGATKPGTDSTDTPSEVEASRFTQVLMAKKLAKGYVVKHDLMGAALHKGQKGAPIMGAPRPPNLKPQPPSKEEGGEVPEGNTLDKLSKGNKKFAEIAKKRKEEAPW